ncbi:hypothetical protein V8E54_005807 [Elaphomyces granulatus]
MASNAPDPQKLKSWKEAFQYPISSVRRVEQQLRQDISSNKDKLRALVGARYRDLLGTAETIVKMNAEIQVVDTNLTDIGRRCNARLIDKKSVNLRRLTRDGLDLHANDCEVAAQLSLLHRCTTLISRLLRKNDSPLLIAKLLVISRLLQKILAQHGKALPFLENLRNQLVSLRRTILKKIDRRLASADATAEDIIEWMSAFCLATSSSSADVIRHFHQVRLEVIGKQLERPDAHAESILEALGLYIRTLQTTKILFSRRLSDALGKLKEHPLLTDPDIRSLDDLDIDTLERYVPNDIRNFTPWIKFSDVTKPEAEKTLKAWSRQTFENLTAGCQRVLSDHHSFPDVISLRKQAIDIWLSTGPSTPTHSSLSVLEGLRNLFNGQLILILRSQAKQLEPIGTKVSLQISCWHDRNHAGAHSLWDPALTSMEYSGGAASFKQAILDTLLGRNADISVIIKAYHSWIQIIEASRKSIEELRRVRWEDGFDEDDDDTPLEPVALLNDDDPHILQQEQKAAVAQALVDLQSSFRTIVQSFGSSDQSDKAGLMLRIIRDLRGEIPVDILEKSVPDFASDIVPGLQEMLAVEVVSHVSAFTFFKGLRVGSQKIPGRTLWEGTPELPVQPLPSTFHFLRRLSNSMERCGSDLWNPSTINVLKRTLRKRVSKSVSDIYQDLNALNPANDSSAPEESPAEPAELAEPNGLSASGESALFETLMEWKVQLLFDTIYLHHALGTMESEQDELTGVIEELWSGVDPSRASGKNLEKTAHGYWKRTKLLFGLIAM